MSFAGKSTLLKVLAGVDKVYDGELEVKKNLRIGYLPQEPTLDDGDTVWSNIAPSLADAQAKLTEFEAVSAASALFAPAGSAGLVSRAPSPPPGSRAPPQWASRGRTSTS